MNDRYARDYWLIRLTPAAARLIEDCMSTKTLKRHSENCLISDRSQNIFKMSKVPDWICERNHAPLWISRWIESGLTIGARRAHLKVPKDDERLVEFAERLRGWADNVSVAGRSARVLHRAAEEIERHASLHPLETLAEALDDL